MYTFFLVVSILVFMGILIFCSACLAYIMLCRQEVTEKELYEYRASCVEVANEAEAN